MVHGKSPNERHRKAVFISRHDYRGLCTVSVTGKHRLWPFEKVRSKEDYEQEMRARKARKLQERFADAVAAYSGGSQDRRSMARALGCIIVVGWQKLKAIKHHKLV